MLKESVIILFIFTYQVKEKEKEELRSEYEEKIKIKDLKIYFNVHKFEKEKKFMKKQYEIKIEEKEKEYKNEILFLNKKLRNLEIIHQNLNKSYERINSQNENFIAKITKIQSKYLNS
jgi:hypothetical protein